MWTRLLLKTNAKNILHQRYWKSFAVCLIATLLISLCGGAAAVVAVIDGVVKSVFYGLGGFGHGFFLRRWLFSGMSMLWAVVMLAFAAVVGLALLFFVQNVLHVGQCRFMMENRYGDSPIETLFSAFQGPYMNVVKGMFSSTVRIMLWSFLLVVPGIYASLKYSMVPYLLAENPYMSPARARELSAAMTEGEKWNIFVLHLSFIGWRMVATLLAKAVTVGFLSNAGFWFLDPYIQATYAELYAALRAKVMAMGITDDTELAGFVRY